MTETIEIICKNNLSKEDLNFLEQHMYTLQIDTCVVLKYTTTEKIKVGIASDIILKAYYIAFAIDRYSDGIVRNISVTDIISNESVYFPYNSVKIESAVRKYSHTNSDIVTCQLSEGMCICSDGKFNGKSGIDALVSIFG